MLRTLLILMLLFPLSACGKRASAVDAPEGTPAGSFPRSYPDIKTDPAPRGQVQP